MKQKVKHLVGILLITAVMACAGTTEAQAQEGEQQFTYGDYTYTVQDGGVEIVEYTGNEETVTIPSQITELPVRKLSGLGEQDSSYKNHKTKKIIVPDGVTAVGGFKTCPNVEEVILPESVKTISEEAFWTCSKLQKVNIPKGLTEIGEGVFYQCSSLNYIKLPDGLKKIGESAFEGCDSLQSIKIPDSVTKIDPYAFSACHKLKTVRLSQNLTVIKKGTFASCTELTGIQIPKKVKRINAKAFAGAGLKTVIIPSNVTFIGSGAFITKTTMKKVVVKSSKITSVGRLAFGNAPQTTFDVPNKCITKYKKLLTNAGSYKEGKTKVK